VTGLSVYFPQNAKGQLVFVANTASGQDVVESTPIGYTPDEIRQAYGIDSIPDFNGQNGQAISPDGTGQTIAIVDAFNDPNIVSDLAQFDQQFNVPAPPSFQVFNQAGINITSSIGTSGPNVPPVDPDPNGGWEGEEALDVEWAHAIAPGANIALIEANSDTPTDELAAIATADSLPGVSVVSISCGMFGTGGDDEVSSEVTLDNPYFTTPGITYVAASGDDGSNLFGYPSASPDVVAVGGTSLYLHADGSYLSETGWEGSGGGISQYEVPNGSGGTTPPSYQSGLGYGARTTPDVAFDADPATGVQVINSFGQDPSNPATWLELNVGGTSLSAPCWAGLIAIADQGRVATGKQPLTGPTQTLPALYQLPDADFHDITMGNNGLYSAGPGYDLVTGRGSPIANLLIPDLINYTANKTITTASSDPNPSVYGQSVTFTATVTAITAGLPTPSGTVEFFDGTTELDTETLDNTGTATWVHDAVCDFFYHTARR